MSTYQYFHIPPLQTHIILICSNPQGKNKDTNVQHPRSEAFYKNLHTVAPPYDNHGVCKYTLLTAA